MNLDIDSIENAVYQGIASKNEETLIIFNWPMIDCINIHILSKN